MFRLYSAITILLDKDPVDAITFDAKNSLSEDKLLRQNIEFRVSNKVEDIGNKVVLKYIYVFHVCQYKFNLF